MLCFLGESSVDVSMIESTGSRTNPNVVHRAKPETLDPTVPNDHPILKVCSLYSESVSDAMEPSIKDTPVE